MTKVDTDLDRTRLDQLVITITKAIQALTNETVHKEVVRHYIRKGMGCESWEDFYLMIDKLALEQQQ